MNFFQRSSLLLSFVFLLTPFMVFAAPKIQLEASTHSVALDETLQLYINIQQEDSAGNMHLSTPEISGLEHFQVVGRSSSTNMQIINGIGTATREQQLRVVPKKEGLFTIGPVEAQYGEEFITSNTIEVSVIPSPTETLKQSLLEDTYSNTNDSQITDTEEDMQDNNNSVTPIQPLKESTKISKFTGANWWFWGIFVLFLGTFGVGIWIGKNVIKRS